MVHHESWKPIYFGIKMSYIKGAVHVNARREGREKRDTISQAYHFVIHNTTALIEKLNVPARAEQLLGWVIVAKNHI